MCRYGEIVAISMQEKLFATMVMMVGFILMQGIVIGGWESILTNHYSPVATFTHRVKTVSACLVSTRMSPRFNCVYIVTTLCDTFAELDCLSGHVAYRRFRLLLRQVVCPPVRNVEVSWSHRLKNSSNIILPLVSLGCSLSADQTSRIYPKKEHPKILPQSDQPFFIWASQTFDGKLEPNGHRYHSGHNGEPIGNQHRSFARWRVSVGIDLLGVWSLGLKIPFDR